MSPIQFTQTVLWLDPEQALAVQSQEQLAAAGLKVRCISNLLELKQELSQGQAFALVIRQTSQNLLKDIKDLMAETGIALPVICRVASYDIKAAVQAMRLGAAHAMEDNECQHNKSQGRSSKSGVYPTYVAVSGRIQHRSLVPRPPSPPDFYYSFKLNNALISIIGLIAI
jgi:hypothetical protein